MVSDPILRIVRPRLVYTGAFERIVSALDKRCSLRRQKIPPFRRVFHWRVCSSVEITRQIRQGTDPVRAICELLRDDMNDPATFIGPLLLQNTAREPEMTADDDLALRVDQRWPHAQIADSGIVVARDEHRALGGSGSLAEHDNAGDAHMDSLV